VVGPWDAWLWSAGPWSLVGIAPAGAEAVRPGAPTLMLVIQRVVTRWSPAGRGAAAATRRGDVPTALPLPQVPGSTDVLVHDVQADEADGYRPSARSSTGQDAAVTVSLQLSLRDDGAVAVRRLPLWVAHPRGPLARGRHLFALHQGQVGRYRLNFRSRRTQCQCAPSWYYEHWIVHVAHVAHAPVAPDLFVVTPPACAVDELTHLYGGTATVRRGRR